MRCPHLIEPGHRAIRAMLGPFTFLMTLAAVCFSGFLYSLWLLGGKEFDLSQIAESLVLIWFGLDGRGLDVSTDFHPILGPAIYVCYGSPLKSQLNVTAVRLCLPVQHASLDHPGRHPDCRLRQH
jgi:hypothetical protein